MPAFHIIAGVAICTPHCTSDNDIHVLNLIFDTDLENAWFGVTVTRKAELWRIDALRENVRAKHYHVTFEPLFDNPGSVDLSGINWIVVGTMTGVQTCALPISA